jgi:hypothetical protein
LSPSSLTAWALAFLEETERLTGRTPIVYTGFYFFRDQAGNPAKLGRFALWEAWYTNAAAPPQIPSVFKGWTFWQYSSSGRVPGITGNVDMNKFCCGIEGLRELSGDAAAPAPTQHKNTPAPVPRRNQETTLHLVFPVTTVAPVRLSRKAVCLTSSVRVRSGPGLSHSQVEMASPGSSWVLGVDAPVLVDGYEWHKVTQCSGAVAGFMAIRMGSWQNECHCVAHNRPTKPVSKQPATTRRPSVSTKKTQEATKATRKQTTKKKEDVTHAPQSTASSVAAWKRVIYATVPTAQKW